MTYGTNPLNSNSHDQAKTPNLPSTMEFWNESKLSGEQSPSSSRCPSTFSFVEKSGAFVQDEERLRRQILDLRRLLHRMKSQDTSPNGEKINEAKEEEFFRQRADLAVRILGNIESMISLESSTAPPDKLEEWNQIVFGLKGEVNSIVSVVLSKSDQSKNRNSSKDPDWIDDIFFVHGDMNDSLDGSDGEIYDDDYFEDEEKEDERDIKKSNRQQEKAETKPRQPVEEDDPTEQAKELEAQISEMASQLKEATEAMHKTLKHQTEGLDEMENLATANLQNVSKVTENVTEHVNRGWRKSVSTWTLLLSCLAVFAFVTITVRTVPKRKSACLFWCDGDSWQWEQQQRRRHRQQQQQQHYGQQQTQDTHSSSSSSSSSSKRKREQSRVTPEGKYSYCEPLEDGSMQCSEPKIPNRNERRNKQQHPDNRHNNDDSTPQSFSCDISEGACRPAFEEHMEGESNTDGNIAKAEAEALLRSVENRDRRIAQNLERAKNGPGIEAVDVKEEKEPKEEEDEDDDMRDDYYADEEDYDEDEDDDEAAGHDTSDNNKEGEEEGIMDSNNEESEHLRKEESSEENIDVSHERTTDDEDKNNDEKDTNDDIESNLTPESRNNNDTRLHFTEEDVRSAAVLPTTDLLHEYINLKPEWVHSRDENGWQALHEAARAGNTDVVELLLTLGGAGVNSRTGPQGDGPSTLWWAENSLPPNHETIILLRKHGAVKIGPGEEFVPLTSHEDQQQQSDSTVSKNDECIEECPSHDIESQQAGKEEEFEGQETVEGKEKKIEEEFKDKEEAEIEADAQRRAESDLRMKAKEEEHQRVVESHKNAVAEAQARRKAAAEEKARLEMEAEAQRREKAEMKRKAEEEARRLVAEVEAYKKAEEDAKRKAAQEEEARRKDNEVKAKAEAHRKAAAEAQRKAAEEARQEEARQKAIEQKNAEERRQKEEEKRLEERQRIIEAQAEAARRKATMEAEARRKVIEEENKRNVEAQRIAQLKAAEEEEKKKKAEDEAREKAVEARAQEEKRKAAMEAEARRKAIEKEKAEAQKKVQEEEAKRKLAEEKRKKAEEEAQRKAAQEEEARRKKAEAQAEEARRKAVEEEIDRKTEALKKARQEEAQRKAEERKNAEAEERQRKVAEEVKKLKEAMAEQARRLAEAEAAKEEINFDDQDIRYAAHFGRNDDLAEYLRLRPEWANLADANGWRAIHEASRSGHVETIRILLNVGVDVNFRTGKKGTGGSALWWVTQRFGTKHPAVELLKGAGAEELSPIL